jgi:hypothetical protein
MMLLSIFLAAVMQGPPTAPPPPPAPPVRIAGPIPQNGDGVVDGVVRRSDNGEPLAGARVILTGLPDRTGALSQLASQADAAGRFEFRNLQPAAYTIRVSLENYFAPPTAGVSGTLLTVPADVGLVQSRSSHALALIPGGVISGSVRSADGAPASNVLVAALRVTYREGRKLLSFAKTIQTDDRGEFRLWNMPPGEYYVRVSRSLDDATGTYYPGVADADLAVLVPVRGADEVSLNLRLSPPKLFRISGTVVNAIPELATDPTEFFLLPRDPKFVEPVAAVSPNLARGRGQGIFEIEAPPGIYDLLPNAAALASGNPRYYTGRARVEVRDRDIEGIAVAVTRGADLSVQVNMGAVPSFRQVTLGFGLRHLDLLTNGLTSSRLSGRPLSADGKTEFLGIPEGTYALTFPATTPGFYVADIRQGARSIYDQGRITVGKDFAEPVEVVVAPNGGSLGGTVEGADKVSSPIRVSLIPEGARRENLLFYRRATLTNGRFAFADVPPGNYKLFAWDDLPTGADENAEFMSPYEQRGRAVTVRAGVASPDVALPLIRR